MLHTIAATQHRKTYGFGSYFVECAWYWGPMSIVHASVFVVGALIIAALAYWSCGHFRRRIRRWGIFSICSSAPLA